jgi:hypothetical protein
MQNPKGAEGNTTSAGAIRNLTNEKLALFVKLRELHLEITKVNQKLAEHGADAAMLSVCW